MSAAEETKGKISVKPTWQTSFAGAVSNGITKLLNLLSSVRFGVTLLFMLFIPGFALGEFAALPDPLARLVFALGTSIALETLLAVLLVYNDLFTPERVFVSVAALTVAAATASFFITLKPQPVA